MSLLLAIRRRIDVASLGAQVGVHGGRRARHIVLAAVAAAAVVAPRSITVAEAVAVILWARRAAGLNTVMTRGDALDAAVEAGVVGAAVAVEAPVVHECVQRE